MKSRYVESKKRTERLVEQARKKAYNEGFKAGKESVSVNKPSGKDSPAKRKE